MTDEDKSKWKCQSCGRLINHNPKGTAAICRICVVGGSELQPEKDEGLLTPEYLDKELCKVLAIRYGYADGETMDWIRKNLFEPLLAKDNQKIEELLKEIGSELWKRRQMFDYGGKPTDDESKCTLSNLMITSQRWATFKQSLRDKWGVK